MHLARQERLVVKRVVPGNRARCAETSYIFLQYSSAARVSGRVDGDLVVLVDQLAAEVPRASSATQVLPSPEALTQREPAGRTLRVQSRSSCSKEAVHRPAGTSENPAFSTEERRKLM